jgi:hypothetical protein
VERECYRVSITGESEGFWSQESTHIQKKKKKVKRTHESTYTLTHFILAGNLERSKKFSS